MEKNQASSIDPLKVLWYAKWRLLILSMVCTVTSYFGAHFIPKVYESESAVLIAPAKFEKTDKDTDALSSIVTYKEVDSLSIGSYKELVYTSGYLQSIIEQLRLKHSKIANSLYPEQLKNMIKIRTPAAPSKFAKASSKLITFKVRGEDPAMITDAANIITTLLTEESRKLRANEIAAIINSIRIQYLSIDKALTDKKHKLKIFRGETSKKIKELHNSVPEEKTNDDMNLQSTLEMTLAHRKTALLYSELEILRVRLHLAESSSKVSSLRAQAKNHPDLLTEDFLNEQSKRDSLLAKEKFLTESIKNDKRIIRALEGRRLSEEEMDREILSLKESLEDLSNRLGEIQILESEKTSDIRFVSKAIKPTIPVYPDIFEVMLMSFVFSLTLAGVITLAKENWAMSVD